MGFGRNLRIKAVKDEKQKRKKEKRMTDEDEEK